MGNKQVTKREPLVVFLLSVVTLGIYTWYWLVKTKGELNRSCSNQIPTALLWLIPMVGWAYWLWLYAESVGQYTNDRCSAPVAFLLLFLTGPIGLAIVQSYYNNEQSQFGVVQ